jgi:hypothetical protein
MNDTKQQNNRANFPCTAQIVDAFRKEFGEGVQLMYAEENGKTIGKKPRAPRHFSDANDWLNSSEIYQQELQRRATKPMLKGIGQ